MPEPQPGAPTREQFVTPAWLERSFVLPVTPVAAATAPATSPIPAPTPPRVAIAAPFVRPATPEVDFAAMVRRADACRRGRRTALGAFLLAVLTVLASFVVSSSIVLPAAMLATLVGLVAALWSDGLTRAPVVVREG